jgi:hypothetical protein
MAALAQGVVVRGPIHHFVPLLGDMVTASGVGLERHEGFPGIMDGAAPLRHPDRSVQ